MQDLSRAMTVAGPFEWAVFGVAIALVLVVDIVAARLGGRTPSVRNAALWSAIWIGLALLFGGWIAMRFGSDAGLTYLTAYLLEKSLSVDNLFVFILIFSQTGIPDALQHRALFWGIVGALIMRAIMIGLGVYLLLRFHWLIYPFAALLLWAAFRMIRGEEPHRKAIESTCSLCTTWIARFIPITPVLEGARFLVRKDGGWKATPLLVALGAIETADLVFALDSIPAVFAVTRDPFLVYTSNIFALFGLRSLYFVLAEVIRGLRFLRTGLAVMLLFVAVKMLLTGVVEIPPGVSLAFIAGIIFVAVVASRLFPGTPTGGAEQANASCTHRDQIRDVGPKTQGCEECTRLGEQWVHLRICLTCGHVGCCDDSKHRHATRHFESTGHPIVRALGSGENWTWCYVDRVTVE
jgi:TerC family integral membrane protein